MGRPVLYVALLILLNVSAATGLCQVPAQTDPSYSTISAASGIRASDIGNYDACMDGGYQHCMLSAMGVGAGVCIPSGCTATDASNATSPLWLQYILPVQPFWLLPLLVTGGNFTVQATCGDNRVPWGAGAIASAVTLLFMAEVVLAATIYTLFRPVAPAKPEGGLNGGSARKSKSKSRSKDCWASLDRVMRGCSLMTTFPAVFGTDKPRTYVPGRATLSSFDGVRVLSMSLVVLGHALVGKLPMATNALDVLRFVAKPAGQVVPSAEFAVDSFLLLSGTLAAYMGVKQLSSSMPRAGPVPSAGQGVEKDGDNTGTPNASDVEEWNASSASTPRRNKDEVDGQARQRRRMLTWCSGAWVVSTIRRYLRLAPSVAVAIALYTVLGPPLLAVGPLANMWQADADACKQQWLRTMLFVQNFAPLGSGLDGSLGQDFSSMCLDHTWYLAAELQMFIVFVVPLCCAYALKPAAGWIGGGISLATTLCVCFAITFQHKLSGLANGIGANLTGNYEAHFYVMPWTRAPAFLVGILLGFALLRWEAGQKEARAQDGAPSSSPVALNSDSGEGGSGEGGSSTNSMQDPGKGKEQPAATVSNPLSSLRDQLIDSPEGTSSWPAVRPIPTRTVQEVVALILPGTPNGKNVDWMATAAMAACLALLGVLFYIPSQNLTGGYTQAGLIPGDAKPWSDDSQLAFTACSRACWAAALAGMLYLCATGRGGVLAAGLGASFWRPIGRLCYWMYLIHPLVITAMDASRTQYWRFGGFTFAEVYITDVVLSAMAAAVLYILVEAPAAALEKELWAKA